MQGLAYEIVSNSSPCIAYLMAENTMATQALVMAHACYGHNSFFKGNHLFRQWTDADVAVLTDLAAAVMTEVGLKRARDAAEAANRAKDRFLATLSHEPARSGASCAAR